MLDNASLYLTEQVQNVAQTLVVKLNWLHLTAQHWLLLGIFRSHKYKIMNHKK